MLVPVVPHIGCSFTPSGERHPSPLPPLRKRCGARAGQWNGHRSELVSLRMTDRRVVASLLVLTLAAFLTGGCGDANQPTATLYLKRNIETSQTGHVIHVLAPVVRAVPENEDAPTRVLEELLRGPTAAEVEDGFVPTLGHSIEVRASTSQTESRPSILAMMPPKTSSRRPRSSSR
jgi:hypothetical protein